MKWLEIIELRSTERSGTFLEEQLKGLIEELQNEMGNKEFNVYTRVSIAGDFSIHLYHESETADIAGSNLGLQISTALKELGLVNHSVWMEKQIN